jgi:3'-phosphoadenosine 5'-phosphosulfate sulfotransferase (PAPS reductase)/FAD synthetase
MQINHVGISGGKDSTALLLWAVHESGYPRESLRVTFCDTGNELDETYAHVEMLSERVHPVEWLKPERDFYKLAEHKQRFPSVKARFCTTELKMEPSRRYVYGLLDEGHKVLLHTGVRVGEKRMFGDIKERDFDDWYALPIYRPLFSWTLEDVWAIHARYGIPRNPLYAMGMKRVGCAPCIMSSKKEIYRMNKLFPERIDRIREAENAAADRGHIATFFSNDKVPECQRTGGEFQAKNGKLFQIATIDDVVRWSRTSYGGIQYELDLDDDEAQACWHHSGLCE